MFGINHEKLTDKLLKEVFPNIKDYDVEDVVKYTLAVKYMSDMSDTKVAIYAIGTIIGTCCFFAISSPILASFSATAAIAAAIKSFKTDKISIEFYRMHKALVIALSEVLKVTPEDVKNILNNINAEDFIAFLEEQKLLKKNKEEA